MADYFVGLPSLANIANYSTAGAGTVGFTTPLIGGTTSYASSAGAGGLGIGAGGLGTSAGILGKLATVSPWVALGILAFLTGGHLDQNVSDTIDSKTRDKLIDYLHGDNSNSDALKVLTGTGENVANWSGLFGVADPLTTGMISGISHGVGTGDAFQGFAKGASGLLTGGISGIVDFFQNQARQQELDKIRNGINVNDFKDFSSNELEALLDYYTDNSGFWFFNRDDIDEDAFLRDYNDYLKWKDEVGEMPAEVDWDAVYNNADFAVDQENKAIQELYDAGLTRSQEMLNRALAENKAAYLDYRNQLLTNDAMSRQALAGSTRYELERQQRNAISRGASAAQRLVANINTQLGLQASSAQQALNTSNALAQQLLNYRNAQTGIRSEYNTALTNYDNQKANLIRGTYERQRNARLGAANEAQMRYNQAMDQWEKRLNSWASDSPWADFYRSSQYRKGTSNKSTYNL